MEKTWITAWEEANCHSRPINDLLIIPQRDIVLTASNDNSIIIWRLSFSQKIFSLSKAHEDAVKSLVFHPPSGQVLSVGLDKQVVFWSLDEQENRSIFSHGVQVIEENEEELQGEGSSQENNVSSLADLQRANRPRMGSSPRINYVLKKKDKLVVDRILEMQTAEDQRDVAFMLVADNRRVSRLTISTKTVLESYIEENQEIMTFCLNKSGTLLITSLIGAFPCFHLWMVHHSSFSGENPFKMFDKRKFYWKPGRWMGDPGASRTVPFFPNSDPLRSLHFRILAANHGSFDKFIVQSRLENKQKKSFTSEEYYDWLNEKEKQRQVLSNNKNKKENQDQSLTSFQKKEWFGESPEKAFLMNRFEGHRWSKLFLRCSFLDDQTFCSSSEDGFLCLWNLNQATPIQKQKVSDFVLNDVAVKFHEEESEGDLQETKNEGTGNPKEEVSLLCANGIQSKALAIAIGCDDQAVRVL